MSLVRRLLDFLRPPRFDARYPDPMSLVQPPDPLVEERMHELQRIGKVSPYAIRSADPPTGGERL